MTNSGYSAEDLVSNLIGFYRAVYPWRDYIGICKPVFIDQSLAIWDGYGAVGDNKNKQFDPVIYPNPLTQCGIPFQGKLPAELNTIKPAVIGDKFKKL
ncbi:MAG: hypothetical protein M3Z21_17265 [Pseudomonadota bacterium]|nr:hypothetical protein [Pseudomonadota bacterium]